MDVIARNRVMSYIVTINKCVGWYCYECKCHNDFIKFQINNLKRLYKEVNNYGKLESYIQSAIVLH